MSKLKIKYISILIIFLILAQFVMTLHFYNISFAENTQDIYDVILFWGQSNMMGCCGVFDGETRQSGETTRKERSEPDPRYDRSDSNSVASFSNMTGISQEFLINAEKMNFVKIAQTPETVYEYQYTTNKLIELTENTQYIGEDLVYNSNTKKLETVDNTTSLRSIQKSFGTNMVQQFCKTYYQRTGHKVVAVFAPNGGQKIANFLPSDDPEYADDDRKMVYEAMAEKYNSAIKCLNNQGYEIGNKLWVCCQGEADVTKNTETSEYERLFLKVHNNLKDDLNITNGAIVETSNTIGVTFYNNVLNIHAEQEALAANNPDIIIGSSYSYDRFIPSEDNYNSNNYSNSIYTDSSGNKLPYKEAFEIASYSVCYPGNTIHFTSSALCQMGKESAENLANAMDSTAPTLSVSYSTTSVTNQDITAIIFANEQIQEVDGWTLSDDKKILTKEYTKNTEEEVVIEDIAGNKTKQIISIKNIDKEGPEINLSIYSAIKPNSNLEINLNVTDELAGANEDSIRYIWSKEKNLNKKDITNKIENNKIIKTPENVIDTYYLYIYAKDKLENETVYRSKEFNLDYTRNENIVFADKLVANSTDKEIIKNNRIYLQSLVDKVSEDGGGIVHIPSGTYYFSGDTNYTESTAVGIVCKNNVTIEGEGIDRTILKPYGEYLHGMNMIHYTDSNKAKTYLINADFRNFTIDNINETSTEYNYQGKGFMLSFTKDCDWESVKVINADGTGFGVNFPINCTMINCYAKGCGKAGTRKSRGSSGFGIETGYSNDESIIISDCKAYENTKYGFVFEHQSIFYDKLKDLEYKASSSNGFIVMNCVAQDNLYDYGGIRAYDLVYENCVSLQPTKVLTDNEGNIYNNKGINFENYSKRVSIINCVLEDEIADVFDKSKSYYEPVYWAYNNGIAERRIQDGKNVFKPNDSTTRGAVASFLYKYMDRPGEIVNGKEKTIESEVLKTSFTDVKIDDYYYEPVEWLNSKKIINTSGTDTEFKPAETCTRAMFITFLYRLAGTPKTTVVNKFEDVGNEGKWYQNAVDWGVSRGIIDDSNTKFYPDEGITRADIVTFLYKYENSKNTSFSNKYYLTGGKLLEENQETYTSGVSEFAINNPTREGYNFVGWTGSNIANYNTLNIEPQKNLSITKENVGNNVYTANWKPIEYKINYIANNGTNESKIQNFTYNVSQKIIKNDFVKEGYVFKEWNTKEDGTGISYSEDKVVNNLSSQDGKTIKLYAQWEKEAVQATGDVTQDGVVNIGDLLKLKQHIAYEQSETTKTNHPNWKLDEEKVLIGDVNKNGKIDVGDILKLRRYIAASTSKEIAERHSDWLKL